MKRGSPPVAPPPALHVRLQYGFGPEAQPGAGLHHPLFEILQAVQAHGSIQRAAAALNHSYRHVWGVLRDWGDRFGEPLVTWSQGQPARLTQFGERLLWAEARARARMAPHLDALRGELERVMADALAPAWQHLPEPLPVWLGHDPALAPLQAHARATQGLHLTFQFTGGLDALRALAEGRCTVAAVAVPTLQHARQAYAPALRTLLDPSRHRLVPALRRTQGLMLAPGNPRGLKGLADLPGTRQAQRAPGSGTRLLMDHLWTMARATGEVPPGPVPPAAVTEDGPLAVAAAVACGAADWGLGPQSAAAACGLDFVALIEEDLLLVCAADRVDSPPLQALRAALSHPAWVERLAEVPGCRPPAAWAAGEVLGLQQALPWWPADNAPRPAVPPGG